LSLAVRDQFEFLLSETGCEALVRMKMSEGLMHGLAPSSQEFRT
jgi:hypothetical protein